jgi:pilus assembly protein Flp/PilA
MAGGLSMFRFLARLGRDANGATAIEYGLILALLVIAMLTGASALGIGVNEMWGAMANKITAVA